MTPTPTVERVARALAKSFGDDPDGFTGSLLNENERWWQHYVKHAIAAIEAMRSLEGIDVQLIYRVIDKTVPENEIGPEEVAAIWRGVLDAALGRGGV